jgi:hypothetical protein
MSPVDKALWSIIIPIILLLYGLVWYVGGIVPLLIGTLIVVGMAVSMYLLISLFEWLVKFYSK